MRPFQLDPDAPKLDNAFQLAYAAKAAYRDDPWRDFPDLALAYDEVILFRHERAFGMVAANSQDVLIAFRGLDEGLDWVDAISFSQADWCGGRAHGGMVRLVEGVWNQLLAAFYDVAALEKTLWITGHSLGGAMATLAAHRLGLDGFDIRLTCTFGAPSVLDPAAGASFDSPLCRFVNNEDPVPAIPWPALLDTYDHVGELVYFLASGRIAENRHSPGLARRIDRAETLGEGILPAGLVADHKLDSYISKLKGHVDLPSPRIREPLR